MRRLLSLLLLLAGSAASSSISPPPSLAGFTPDRAAWERKFEKRLLALPRPEECSELLREITRTPHLAGTEGNKRVADLVAASTPRDNQSRVT